MCDIMDKTISDEFDEEILMLLLKKPSVLIDDFVAYPNMYGGSPGKAIVRLSNSEKYRTTTKIISDFKTIGVFETRNTIYISTRGSFYQRNVSKFA